MASARSIWPGRCCEAGERERHRPIVGERVSPAVGFTAQHGRPVGAARIGLVRVGRSRDELGDARRRTFGIAPRNASGRPPGRLEEPSLGSRQLGGPPAERREKVGRLPCVGQGAVLLSGQAEVRRSSRAGCGGRVRERGAGPPRACRRRPVRGRGRPARAASAASMARSKAMFWPTTAASPAKRRKRSIDLGERRRAGELAGADARRGAGSSAECGGRDRRPRRTCRRPRVSRRAGPPPGR